MCLSLNRVPWAKRLSFEAMAIGAFALIDGLTIAIDGLTFVCSIRASPLHERKSATDKHHHLARMAHH